MKKLLLVLSLVCMAVVSAPLSADNGDDMDTKRENAANKIISNMVEDGASQSDINAQKKANKRNFGHEGDYE